MSDLEAGCEGDLADCEPLTHEKVELNRKRGKSVTHGLDGGQCFSSSTLVCFMHSDYLFICLFMSLV